MPELDDDDLNQCARNATSDIFGKLDDEIPPIRINGDVLDRMRRSAREAGFNLSEYLRHRLYVSEFGFEHISSLYAQRLRRATGNASQMPGEVGK